VLEYLAPSTPVWTMLPTFLRQTPLAAGTMVALWGGVALLGGRLLGRHETARLGSGAAHAIAWTAIGAAGAGASVVATMLPPSTPPPHLAERSRVRMLDEFDARRRPFAIRYDPLTRVDPAQVPASFPLVVHAAGDRSTGRDAPLFGRRLSLPTGTYGVDLVFPVRPAAVAGTLAVHAGRTSPPLQGWDVALTPPGSWGRAFSLPVDVGYVGFRASDSILQAAPHLRVTPQHVVDVSARPQTPAVLGSARFGDTVVLVHGDDAWPERDGVWIRGRSTATLTLTWPAARPGITLALRAGPQPVTVRVQWGGLDEMVVLRAGQRVVTFLARQAVPHGAAGTGQLRLTPSTAFVPAEIEPGSRDRRPLGCWVEFDRPDDAPPAGASGR